MTLPRASLRIIDEGGSMQRVDVIVDGEPVAVLPITSVSYSLELRGIGKILVGVNAVDVNITAGDRVSARADIPVPSSV